MDQFYNDLHTSYLEVLNASATSLRMYSPSSSREAASRKWPSHVGRLLCWHPVHELQGHGVGRKGIDHAQKLKRSLSGRKDTAAHTRGIRTNSKARLFLGSPPRSLPLPSLRHRLMWPCLWWHCKNTQ